MNTENYQELNDELVKRMTELLPERQKKAKAEILKEKIDAEMKKVVDEGKIFTLAADEVEVLAAYRLWKMRPESASDVFHYREKR